MYGVFWHAVVKPGKKQDLFDFLKWDLDVAKETEPGTVRFDIFEDRDNPDGLYVYELYIDQDAFAEHQKHEPFLRWSDEIRTECLAEGGPLMGFSHTVLSMD